MRAAIEGKAHVDEVVEGPGEEAPRGRQRKDLRGKGRRRAGRWDPGREAGGGDPG